MFCSLGPFCLVLSLDIVCAPVVVVVVVAVVVVVVACVVALVIILGVAFNCAVDVAVADVVGWNLLITSYTYLYV